MVGFLTHKVQNDTTTAVKILPYVACEVKVCRVRRLPAIYGNARAAEGRPYP